MFPTIALAPLAPLAAAMVAAGGLTGLLAGLFGVGGGTVIVPVLYEVFGLLGVPDDIRMQMCVGTSLAVIVPTSVTSLRSHMRKGAVDMGILRKWAAPIVVGVVLGTWVARYASPALFKGVFSFVCLALALRLFLGKDRFRLGDALPGEVPMTGYGLAIGGSSALMGIGGGLLGNLVLSLYGTPIHRAVATSAGIGLLVSIPGAIGYMAAGAGHPGLPPLSLGYVSLVGFLLLVPMSLAAVPLGVRLAHGMSKQTLERALAVYVVLISLRFILSMAGL